MKVVYNDAYQSLFDAAAAELRDRGLDVPKIEDLVTYYSYIAELRSSGKNKFIRIPLDEYYFDVDLNTRSITVPDAFIENGIGVQGDSMAETLFFRVDRFYDDIDLSVCIPAEAEGVKQGMCFIQWENGRGEQGLDPVQFADIDGNQIIFGWPLHDGIMYAFKDGNSSLGSTSTVKFSVRFEYHENEKIDSAIIFSLHTLPATCTIHGNLIDPKKSLQIEDITDQLNKRPAFSGIYDSTLGPKAYIIDDLPNYANLDIANDGTTETTINDDGDAVLTVNAKATGTLKYVWNVDGKIDTSVTGPEYIAKNVGRYMVQVGNEYKTGSTRWTDSNTTEILGPSEFKITQDLVDQGYADGQTALTVVTEVADDERGVPNGVLSYTWYRDTEVIPDATEATYVPTLDEPGMYHVEVVNTFNRKASAPVISSKSELKAPVRKPTAVTASYNADQNMLTANVTTDFNNDLYYIWINSTELGKFGPFTENTYVPTTNGKYQCQVYQHCFIGGGDLDRQSDFEASEYVDVTNAK